MVSPAFDESVEDDCKRVQPVLRVTVRGLECREARARSQVCFPQVVISGPHIGFWGEVESRVASQGAVVGEEVQWVKEDKLVCGVEQYVAMYVHLQVTQTFIRGSSGISEEAYRQYSTCISSVYSHDELSRVIVFLDGCDELHIEKW